LSITVIPLLFTITAILSSCVSAAKAKDGSLYVWLTNSSRFILLPAQYIENPINGFQLFSAAYDKQEFQVNALVIADGTGMNMTLFNELGANMGELSWRNGEIYFSSSVFPKSLKPEYIIADFQLCFYESAALAKALKDCGLVLEDTGGLRRVLKGKTVIMEIEKNMNSVKITNHLRGYSYSLEDSVM
jgi:hypothetical protein